MSQEELAVRAQLQTNDILLNVVHELHAIQVLLRAISQRYRT